MFVFQIIDTVLVSSTVWSILFVSGVAVPKKHFYGYDIYLIDVFIKNFAVIRLGSQSDIKYEIYWCILRWGSRENPEMGE